MNKAKRTEILERLQAQYPGAKTELNYTTNFELLVSVMLSAQMTDKGVNKATAVLFPIANTPEAFVELGEDGLREYLKSINLFKTKTKNAIKLSEMLLEQHNGEVPDTREALEALPGVGRKTANVVLSIAFDQATMAVDTHIFRLSNRTKFAPGKDPRAVEDKLLKVVPEQFRKDAHHWLILHGRYVCKARSPECEKCCIYELCEYKEKIDVSKYAEA